MTFPDWLKLNYNITIYEFYDLSDTNQEQMELNYKLFKRGEENDNNYN